MLMETVHLLSEILKKSLMLIFWELQIHPLLDKAWPDKIEGAIVFVSSWRLSFQDEKWTLGVW